LRKHDWVIQPKLEGDRACVGVIDGKVYIQNRHGSWYKHRVNNLDDFKKLPNATVLDGEVFKGKFYAFDCLVSDGTVHLMATASEREVLAFQLTKYLRHEWKFERPSKAWVAKLHAQMPIFGGVVLKRMNSEYVIHGSPNQSSLNWLKRTWG
jgi:ATP-dependent DNA ligase